MCVWGGGVGYGCKILSIWTEVESSLKFEKSKSFCYFSNKKMKTDSGNTTYSLSRLYILYLQSLR